MALFQSVDDFDMEGCLLDGKTYQLKIDFVIKFDFENLSEVEFEYSHFDRRHSCLEAYQYVYNTFQFHKAVLDLLVTHPQNNLENLF